MISALERAAGAIAIDPPFSRPGSIDVVTSTGRLPNADFLARPVWWDDNPPRPTEEKALPRRCDVLVIGGGIAGLNAALELGRNGVDTLVVDADDFGANASARNSGGVSFGLSPDKVAGWHRWARNRTPPAPADLIRGAGESLGYIEAFIEKNAIDCDYHRRGRLVCASLPSHYDTLARRAERLNALVDAGAYMVPRREQTSEIDSDAFHGVMVVSRSGQLDPGRYLHALVRLCERAGVGLHARTRAVSVERRSTDFLVATSKGPVEAANVVLAAHIGAGQVSPGLGRRIVPVASHIIVTEALPGDLADRLLPRRRTGADSRRLLAYFRRTPDGRRFLYGGRAAGKDASGQRAAARLYKRMVEHFPQLDGIRISHAWGCQVAFTFDGIPHMGAHDGLYYVLGCNGNGVAMMTYLGHQIARKLLTAAPSTCVFDQAVFPYPPLYSGRPWFLPLVAQTYRAMDGLGKWREGRDTRAAG
jgi:glycine/D-amino acid oxidase-like deaminating enzyme